MTVKIIPTTNRPFPAEDKARARALREQGLTYAAIARALGRAPSTIQSHLTSQNEPTHKQSRVNWTTEELVLLARLVADGAPRADCYAAIPGHTESGVDTKRSEIHLGGGDPHIVQRQKAERLKARMECRESAGPRGPTPNASLHPYISTAALSLPWRVDPSIGAWRGEFLP
jgi:transposase-like protein